MGQGNTEASVDGGSRDCRGDSRPERSGVPWHSQGV